MYVTGMAMLGCSSYCPLPRLLTFYCDSCECSSPTQVGNYVYITNVTALRSLQPLISEITGHIVYLVVGHSVRISKLANVTITRTYVLYRMYIIYIHIGCNNERVHDDDIDNDDDNDDAKTPT